MIIDKENKKLSGNRKRRIERRIKIYDKMKSLLNKIKTKKKKKNKNFDKIEELEIKLVKIKYSNNPKNLQSELKELNKIQVNVKSLHEMKNETLGGFVGDFKKVSILKVGDQFRQINIRLRNMDDLEAYFNAVDECHDAKDAIFNGYIFKLDSPKINKVNRSQYGNCCDFKHEIIEYRENDCFIPTEGYSFVKCNNFLTGEGYKEHYLDIIRSEQRRSNIMTKARIQPFCTSNNINLGNYDGERVFPRSVTDRNNALFLCNYHFCLIWKSEGVSFKEANKKLKKHLK